MKHKFTKLMAMLAILLISVWSVNAQTPSFTWDKSEITTAWANASAASTVKVMGGVTLEQIGTAGVVNNYIDLNNSNSNLVLNATGNDALTITSTDVITKIEMNFSGNSSSNTPNPYFGFHSVGTSMGSASATVSSCLQDATGVTGTTGVTKTYIPPAGTKFAIIVRGKACDPIASSGATARIYNIKVYTQPAAPSITKFVAEGVDAIINQNANPKTITAELPYGTNLTSITPVVTIGGTATSYSPTGAQDFSGGAVNYIASDGTPANDVTYAVTLTVNPTPSSDKNLSNVMIGGKTPTFDAGTNTYSITLPKAYDITSQVVTFTKPGTATANFTSGATHDFTNPLQITVTAQDASTKVYTLTAAVGNKNIAYIINTAVTATDTKIRPELAKTNYIDNIQIGTVTTSTDFAMYDLVILTESPSSGSAGMRALWGINKPLLALKIFALNSNTWDKGTQASPAAPASTTATVYEPNHPIFSGISLTGALNNEIVSIGAITTGNGLQTSNYSGDYLIGGVGTSPAIIEFPINTPAGAAATGYKNQNLIEKLLVLGISDNNQDKLTEDGLKLVTNAVNYLTGTTSWGTNAGTDFQSISFTGNAPVVGLTSATIAWQAVPAAVKYVVTQVTPSGVKGVSTVKSAINVDVPGNETSLDLTGLSGSTSYQFNVAAENSIGKLTDPAIITFSTWFTGVSSATLEGVNFDGRTIQNPDRQQLHVFDATGRLLLTSREDINMSAQAKGVYLVKSENGMMKIAVTK